MVIACLCLFLIFAVASEDGKKELFDASEFTRFSLCAENGYAADLSTANLGSRYGIAEGPTLASFGANITVAMPLFNDAETPAAAIFLLEMGTWGVDKKVSTCFFWFRKKFRLKEELRMRM
jgi:hypothetical protein